MKKRLCPGCTRVKSHHVADSADEWQQALEYQLENVGQDVSTPTVWAPLQYRRSAHETIFGEWWGNELRGPVLPTLAPAPGTWPLLTDNELRQLGDFRLKLGPGDYRDFKTPENVEALEIQGPASLYGIASTAKLKSLTLTDCGAQSDVILRCRNLETLRLAGTIGRFQLPADCKLSKLTVTGFVSGTEDDFDFEWLTTRGNLRGLQELEIISPLIGDEQVDPQVAFFTDMDELPHEGLKVLKLRARQTAALQRGLGRVRQELQTNLNVNNVSNVITDYLESKAPRFNVNTLKFFLGQKFYDIYEVELEGFWLNPEAFWWLRVHLPKLLNLRLLNCTVGQDEVAAWVQSLKKELLPRLAELSLRGCDFLTDIELQELCEAGAESKLLWLDLRGTRVHTAAGVENLPKLRELQVPELPSFSQPMPKLESLRVDYECDANGLQQVLHKCPALRKLHVRVPRRADDPYDVSAIFEQKGLTWLRVYDGLDGSLSGGLAAALYEKAQCYQNPRGSKLTLDLRGAPWSVLRELQILDNAGLTCLFDLPVRPPDNRACTAPES